LTHSPALAYWLTWSWMTTDFWAAASLVVASDYWLNIGGLGLQSLPPLCDMRFYNLTFPIFSYFPLHWPSWFSKLLTTVIYHFLLHHLSSTSSPNFLVLPPDWQLGPTWAPLPEWRYHSPLPTSSLLPRTSDWTSWFFHPTDNWAPLGCPLPEWRHHSPLPQPLSTPPHTSDLTVPPTDHWAPFMGAPSLSEGITLSNPSFSSSSFIPAFPIVSPYLTPSIPPLPLWLTTCGLPLKILSLTPSLPHYFSLEIIL